MKITKKRFFIVLVTLVAAVATAVILYFSIWRPSDADYSALSGNLNQLTASMSGVQQTSLDIKYASDISDSAVTNLEKAANKFNTEYELASKSPVIARDLAVKHVFEVQDVAIKNYGAAANSLASSLRKYVSISVCSGLFEKINTISNLTDFDKTFKPCSGAISVAQGATYGRFNDQYLKKYTVGMAGLVSAYRKIVSAANSGANYIPLNDVDDRIKSIAALRSNKILLSPTAPPIQALNELKNTTNSQKKVLFR